MRRFRQRRRVVDATAREVLIGVADELMRILLGVVEVLLLALIILDLGQLVIATRRRARHRIRAAAKVVPPLLHSRVAVGLARPSV